MTNRSCATHRLQQLTTSCLMPLLVLLMGCNRITGIDPRCPLDEATSPGACDQTPVGKPFTTVFSAEDGTAGLLFNASGAIVDAGRVEGDLLRVDLADTYPDTWSGTRGLRGAKGIIALMFEGEIGEAEAPQWQGRFTLLPKGTGAYAGLRGQGIFTVRLDEQGRAVETFTGIVLQ